MNDSEHHEGSARGNVPAQLDEVTLAQPAQAASRAEQAAATAATFAGTWSTTAVGASRLAVGLFPAVAARRSRRQRRASGA
jgi:hypothetical protein